MSIITKSKLSQVANSKIGYRNFSDVLNEAKGERKSLTSASIFLSHSHDDLEKEAVNTAIVFLRNLGLRVYIDSDDSSMPPFTNAATAAKIKAAIKENNKFILLATNKAIASKWCNWELGFGDAQKYLDKIALFPLAENAGNWDGSEYLKIYPRIEESNTFNDSYNVYYPDGSVKSIKDWLLI